MNYKIYKVTVYENGDKIWRNDKGQLHNEHGPAAEWADGGKAYWLNDKLNRTDGPAIEWADGSKSYYLNGKYYSHEDWRKEVEKLNKPSKVLNKEETIERLCDLVTHIGGKHFENKVSHDCFCGKNPLDIDIEQIDESIIEFIEDAVKEKMEGANNA